MAAERDAAERQLEASAGEVERLTQQPPHMLEQRLLEAEAADLKFQVGQLTAQLAAAREDAAFTEQAAAEARRELRLLAMEREEAVVRAQEAAGAWEQAAGQAAAARGEGARAAQEAASLRQALEKARGEQEAAQGFAEALELQLEGLKERSQRQLQEHRRRVAALQAASAPGSQAAAQQMAALMQQNSTLKAAAARLSRALMAMTQKQAVAGGRGGAGPGDAGLAADVLGLLTAVEQSLAEMPA